MKTNRLTDSIKNTLLAPSATFEEDNIELYVHTKGKYERRIGAANVSNLRRLADRIQNFLLVLLLFPMTAKNKLQRIAFIDIREDMLVMFLNVLTKLFAFKDIDGRGVSDKTVFATGNEVGELWPILAKSRAYLQPALLEKLVDDFMIFSFGSGLRIKEYGSFMLSLSYYRALRIIKPSRDKITECTRVVVPPLGMVAYLQTLVPMYNLDAYNDENLKDSVYYLAGLHPIFQALKSRYGYQVITRPVTNPPNISPVDLSHRKSPVSEGSQTTSSTCASMASRISIPFLEVKDELVSQFEPPNSYQDVKTFVYKYGSRLLSCPDEIVEKLIEKMERHRADVALNYKNVFHHNMMALYMNLIGLIRNTQTVTPIAAKVERVVRFTKYRAQIELSYPLCQQICDKLCRGEAIGIYTPGSDTPSILAIIVSKRQQVDHTKYAHVVTARRLFAKCLLSYSGILTAGDSVGITASIPIREVLKEARAICDLKCELEGKPRRKSH